MATIKKVQFDDRLIQQMQTNLIEAITPLINNPITQGQLLQKVSLIAGTNVIPTTLNRPLVGWIITRLRAAASIYDNQDNNTTPTKNLLLVSSAPVVVDIYVY